MENFLGMHRDSARVKNPVGTWEFAQNLLMQKGKGSISNEYGFDIQAPIPGDYLGCIATNEETVVFSIDNGFSCIGTIRTDNPFVYIPKIRSIYLGFKINRPIEGVFFYNYRKELIIVFSDGVFRDSNTPKLVNLHTVNTLLNGLYEFLTPALVGNINLFPTTLEGQLDISYTGENTLPIDIVYISFCYVLDDNISTTAYFPASHIAYSEHEWEEKNRRRITLNFTELDNSYGQIRIGLLVYHEGSIIGYESDNLSFLNNSLSFTIDSLTPFKETASDIFIPTIFYNRIKSMTIQDNRLVIGNIATSDELDSEVNNPLQKYINKLEVGLKFVTDRDDLYNHPTLCPDEVYAIYIQPQLLSGEYLNAYPLIGPNPNNPSELNVLDNAALTALGLHSAGQGVEVGMWKEFHIKNTGGFVLPAPYIDNNAHNELRWGYWENEETYPNIPEFDSTVDYNGNPLGGSDLRNTPIKYFRVPGLDAIAAKVPCLTGYTHENKSTLINNEAGTEFYGRVPRFGVYIKNFEAVFPTEILDKLQGFKILIVKRKNGNKIVEDITYAKNIAKIPFTDNYEVYPEISVFGNPFDSFGDDDYHPNTVDIDRWYGKATLYSPTLLHTKATISPRLVKVNYAMAVPEPYVAQRPITGTGYTDVTRFTLLPDDQRYAIAQRITYRPVNNIAASNEFSEEKVVLFANNYLEGTDKWNPFLIVGTTSVNTTLQDYNSTTRLYAPRIYSGGAGSSAYNQLLDLIPCITLLNLQKNIYFGFNPKEFIVLGRVSLSNSDEVVRHNGDVFTNNYIRTIKRRVNTFRINVDPGASTPNWVYLTVISTGDLLLKGLWAVQNNSSIKVEDTILYGGETYNISGGPPPLDSDNYEYNYYNNEIVRNLNDLVAITAKSVQNTIQFLNYFPFRVARTPKIANENLSTNVLRTFRANDYYEMPNNRGEVIAVRGTARSLYIQQKHSLFVASLKDKLNTGQTETYLGEGDIFDRTPDEIKFNTDKGYIGCTNQIACIIFPEGYAVVDQIKGNIFIIGTQFTEVTKIGMTNWFQENWNTEGYYTLDRFGNKQPVDNPYNSIGHLVGYDETYNRLLFTKKYYRFLFPNLVGTEYSFDGEFYYQVIEDEEIRLDYNNSEYFKEESKTLSFDIGSGKWISEHTYFPNGYYFNTFGLFSFHKDITNIVNMYKHNSLTQNRGTYYDNVTYASYIDLIFNGRLDLVKHYQAVEWESVVEAINGARLYNKTIDKVAIYSDYQCSGEVDVNQFTTARNTEGLWQLNEFRDIAVDRTLPLVREDGSINVNNLNNNRSYFEKSFFIGTFVVVRLIMLNNTTDDVYINFVNVKSRISKR